MNMKAPSIYNISIWRDTVYNLEPISMRLFDEIMLLLDEIEPMRDNNSYKRVWVSEERGTVADMRFDDIDNAMDYFEVESEQELEKAFLERYPDEKYWFMLEAMKNEECRILRINHLAVCIYNKIPEHVDNTAHDIADYLQWTKNALSTAMSLATQGLYTETVEKELPYSFRYGIISRKELFDCRPTCKEDCLKDLSEAEIERFIRTIEAEGDNYVPDGRIKGMTFDMYFDYASKAFGAAGFDISGMTPYELFRRYGEDFGGNVLESIPHNTPEGFDYYYDDKHHMGGHPWGLLRGSSRTRLFLWPRLTDEGFYFTFSGNENFRAYEMVKMYLTLKDHGMPVRFGGLKEGIIRYLRQEDLIGIVPGYEIALYQHHEFPDQKIDDFMHFYPDEDDDIADYIQWQPIMPIVLKKAREGDPT